MKKPTGEEILEELFQEDEALTQLKDDLAELDSQMFRFSKSNDLTGSAKRSYRLMRIRRASLEIKIATYGA